MKTSDGNSHKNRLPNIGERALIGAVRRRAATASGALRMGIGDDCAVLRPAAGDEVVVTTDFSLERVHFRRDWHVPEVVGHRCLARGLSDLAAMGARPMAAFLSIALPVELTVSEGGKSWFDRFLDGLLALADRCKVPLAGGDTAQSPEMNGTARKYAGLVAADIVLLGAVKRGKALLRSKAHDGDVIYVTGGLGGAAAELLAVGRDPAQFAALTRAEKDHPHLYPEPRLAVAQKLVSAGRIHAAIDLSDGLSTDLGHVCEESGLAAELDAAAIPVHALAQKVEQEGWVPSAMALALHGGEDYELLFTAPRWTKIARKVAGVEIHPIGQMVKKQPRRPRIVLRERDGRRTALEAGGWEHFGS